MNDMHRMDLTQQNDDGSEEYTCSACGRRVIIRWSPEFKRQVLEAGDETVQHGGGTGGLTMGDVEVKDPRLEPFERYLSRRGGL